MSKKGFSYTHIRQNKWFQALVVFMCCCYLIQPLHQPVGTVFHSLSHFLGMPDQLIDSSSENSEKSNFHAHHQHQLVQDQHHHVIIDFFVSVFKANEPTSEKGISLMDILELEEHLVYITTGFDAVELMPTEINRNVLACILTGFSNSLLKPPIA